MELIAFTIFYEQEKHFHPQTFAYIQADKTKYYENKSFRRIIWHQRGICITKTKQLHVKIKEFRDRNPFAYSNI